MRLRFKYSILTTREYADGEIEVIIDKSDEHLTPEQLTEEAARYVKMFLATGDVKMLGIQIMEVKE